jgi:hypothetical protein
VVTDWLTLRLYRLQRRGASPLTTQDFLSALFDAVDEEMRAVPKHPEAKLSPRAGVTLALLLAITGGGRHAF